MSKWLNNAGMELEINDNQANIDTVLAAGWKPLDKGIEEKIIEDYSPVEMDARGVPFDAEIHSGEKYKNGNWKYVKGMTAKKAAPREAELVHAIEG